MPDYSTTGAVFPLKTYAITDVDTGTETFVIDGDQTERFEDAGIFSVVGSTGNDGEYTVVSTSYSEVNDETTITVVEDITDATVDGTIVHSEKADTLPLTLAHDDADDRDAAAPEEYAGAHGQRLANELRALGEMVGNGFGCSLKAGAGLVIYFSQATLLKGSGTPVHIEAGTLTLTDNDENYIEVDIAGTVSSNVVGFTTGHYPLGLVTTLASAITNIVDTRSVLYLAEFAEANLDEFGPSFNAATELTISGGVITRTQGIHRVDTEGDSPSDELNTINGGTAPFMVFIRAENDARTVILKDGTGNLELGGEDITLDDTDKFVLLLYDGTLSKWVVVGGVGGGLQLSDLSDVVSVVYTAGYVLRANGAGFVAARLQHGDLGGVGSSDHHARYADGEAVSAMGAKADGNPLNHDRPDLTPYLNKDGSVDIENTTYEAATELTIASAFSFGSVDIDDYVAFLTAYWKMEATGANNRLDSVGSNDAVPSATPGTRAGINNNACDFVPGSSQYLTVPDSADIKPTTGMAVSLWVYMDDTGTDRGIFYKEEETAWGGCYRLVRQSGGSTEWMVRQSDNTNKTVLVADTLDGAWHHVVVMACDGFLRFYIDNVEVGTPTAYDDTVDQDTTVLDIGRHSGAGYYMDGGIDEMAFWKNITFAGGTETADREAFVAALYNSGVGRFGAQADGLVTRTQAVHTIDTEGDIPSDDLNTISGGADGLIVRVRAENAARTVVLKDGVGNLALAGSDVTLDDVDKFVDLQYDGVLGEWVIVGAAGSVDLAPYLKKDGSVDVENTTYEAAAELTIAAGVVTRTQASHRIDTQGDAPSDELATISGGADGLIVRVRAENAARTVVLKDGTGNLELGGDDITLDDTNKFIALQYDGTLSKWLLVGEPSGVVVVPGEAVAFEVGHGEILDAISLDEFHRFQLQAGETFTLTRLELQLKGGGTDGDVSVDVYDDTGAAQLDSVTAGAVSVSGGVSSAAALMLVRVSNASGGNVNATIIVHGYITPAPELVALEMGHGEIANGLSSEEIHRFQLQGGEVFTLSRLELQLKGGGTDADVTVDVYDSTGAAVIDSVSAGAVSVTGGASGTASLILVRLSNASGGDVNGTIIVRGVIE